MLSLPREQIWNCDEAGFPLNPVSTKVVGRKGAKNIYQVVNKNEKENVSVLIMVNAAGQVGPLFVLFKGINMPNQAAANAPKDFMFGVAEEGMMDSCPFYILQIVLTLGWWKMDTKSPSYSTSINMVLIYLYHLVNIVLLIK
uniref:DDE-1 domain-containing protein n=1 Tax=Trichogramma kaykai TaxID=54128 RepID=A0ABD2WTJ0_9HYME